jgi:hypothetical protein
MLCNRVIMQCKCSVLLLRCLAAAASFRCCCTCTATAGFSNSSVVICSYRYRYVASTTEATGFQSGGNDRRLTDNWDDRGNQASEDEAIDWRGKRSKTGTWPA